MRQPLFLLPILLLGACSLISPYTITFTNTPGEVVDPATSTLDFVVSASTLAYISGVSCEGAEPMDILPLANKEGANTVHKLPLTLMKDQPSGAKCEVTVTAYDKTTTEQSSASIELTMNGTRIAVEGELCGGIAGFQCADGLICEIPDSTVSDASGTCVKPSESAEETAPVVDTAVEATPETAVEPEASAESTETSTETTTSSDSSATPW